MFSSMGRVYLFNTFLCKEWLESQGLELSREEDLPVDPYAEKERWKKVPPPKRSKSFDDPFRRFLEYNGKVLAFNVLWDDRDSVNGELSEYKLFYFLQDDTVAIKEIHDGSGGKDPFPMLLKKTKLPKKWKEKPVSFPSIVMETTEEEVTEYYAPRDLIVGETIFVFSRRFLIYDCDDFTRRYYKTMLNIVQPPKIEIPREKTKEVSKAFPPHIGIGAPEDTLQSCFGLMPKPPQKDIIKYNLNANKYLRYLCELDWIHPEDKDRKFVMSYSLADGTIKIGEIPRRNSGIREGKFLSSRRLQTPDSDPNFPTYFTPDKFYIGAVIPVFKHRFKIVGCDLFVYRYMSANPDKFPQEVINNVRNYHMREGNLKDELEEAVREQQANETRAQLAKIGQAAVAEPDAMERCLADLRVVEGSAIPPRPSTPPATTDRISYDDSLRAARLSKPICDNVIPLKGTRILKSGDARDDHQKVVCFSGPTADVHGDNKSESYPSGQHPQYNKDPNFCEKYKDPGVTERADRRVRNECHYEILQSSQILNNTEESVKPDLPGYLGTYGVDCKNVAEHMRLPKDAYEQAKTLRQEIPKISPAAERVADLPREASPSIEICLKPLNEEDRPCLPQKEEDVAFSCPHAEPSAPCCDPNKRDSQNL